MYLNLCGCAHHVQAGVAFRGVALVMRWLIDRLDLEACGPESMFELFETVQLVALSRGGPRADMWG